MHCHRPPRLFALLVLAIVFLSACTEKPTLPEGFDYQIDMNEYESAVLSDGKAYLKLANKQHSLGAGYVPNTLSTLPTELTLNGKDIRLESTAATAAEALVRELHVRGYTDIVITSGYRDYAYQQSLFNTYLDREMKAHPDWSQAKCEAEVLTYSARPGTSEHQTGLCIDLISTQNVVLDESFAGHPVYRFLVENAHAFGFVLRYPKGKEEVTGYTYEPWHYRFVGVEAATEMHETGLTLEEYLGEERANGSLG